MPGTEIAYAGTISSYAITGTDKAYAGTRMSSAFLPSASTIRIIWYYFAVRHVRYRHRLCGC
eukprot:2845837-Rhodomonas_salina.4